MIEVEQVLFAVADRSRRAMVQRLAMGPATAGQLAELLPVSRAAASQHLKVLQDSKLVETTVLGRQRWQQLRPDTIDLAAAWLTAVADRGRRAPALHLDGRNSR